VSHAAAISLAICTALTSAACGRGTAPHATPRDNTERAEQEGAPMTGAVSPAGDKHPGQIVYDDHVEHRTWTREASEVSAAMAWVKVDDRWKPVVRIEIDGQGERREMTSFGPNREFLEHTTARLSPPGPAASEPTPVPTPAPTPSR
jgi:hypothetical protein